MRQSKHQVRSAVIHDLNKETVDEILEKTNIDRHLDLSNNEISVLRNLDLFPATTITFINLSYNQVRSVNFAIFVQFTALKELNLAGNQITSVTNGTTLETHGVHIAVLDLSYNCIRDVAVLEHVNHTAMPSLRHLLMRGNPVAQSPNYRGLVASACAGLITLDNVSFSKPAQPKQVKMIVDTLRPSSAPKQESPMRLISPLSVVPPAAVDKPSPKQSVHKKQVSMATSSVHASSPSEPSENFDEATKKNETSFPTTPFSSRGYYSQDQASFSGVSAFASVPIDAGELDRVGRSFHGATAASDLEMDRVALPGKLAAVSRSLQQSEDRIGSEDVKALRSILEQFSTLLQNSNAHQQHSQQPPKQSEMQQQFGPSGSEGGVVLHDGDPPPIVDGVVEGIVVDKGTMTDVTEPAPQRATHLEIRPLDPESRQTIERLRMIEENVEDRLREVEAREFQLQSQIDEFARHVSKESTKISANDPGDIVGLRTQIHELQRENQLLQSQQEQSREQVDSIFVSERQRTQELQEKVRQLQRSLVRMESDKKDFELREKVLDAELEKSRNHVSTLQHVVEVQEQICINSSPEGADPSNLLLQTWRSQAFAALVRFEASEISKSKVEAQLASVVQQNKKIVEDMKAVTEHSEVVKRENGILRGTIQELKQSQQRGSQRIRELVEVFKKQSHFLESSQNVFEAHVSRAINALERRISKYLEQVKLVTSHVSDKASDQTELEFTIKRLQNEVKTISSKYAMAESELKQKDAALDEQRSKVLQLEGAITQLNNQIKQSKVASEKKHSQVLEELETEHERELKEVRVENASLERDIGRLTVKLRHAQRDLVVATEDKTKEMNNRIQYLEDRLKRKELELYNVCRERTALMTSLREFERMRKRQENAAIRDPPSPITERASQSENNPEKRLSEIRALASELLE